MTVLDTSGVVDLLTGGPTSDEVAGLVAGSMLAAPDVLVFETLSVLRRDLRRGAISRARADRAVSDLGGVPIDLFPSLRLRDRAWDLRENLTAADALFAALAERLAEPLATGDRGLARAARERLGIAVIELGVS